MKTCLYFPVFLLLSCNIFAQSVTIDPRATSSGIINVQSTNKGVLVPNMTTAQREAISSAQKGLLVFDSNTSSFWFHNGVGWNELINNNSSYWSPSGTELTSTGFSNFNFSNGSAISPLSTGFFPNGNDGTLRVYSSGNVLGRDFLTLDANSIQARNYNLFSGKAEIPLRINPFGGNVGIGLTTPTAKLHVGGNIKIDGTNVLEFGAGVAGKNANAGKIGYQTFGTNDALDIVGAGITNNRKIRLWAEAGTTFTGGLSLPGKIVNIDYAPTDRDFTIIADMENNPTKLLTITLPTASALNEGKIYIIRAIRLPNLSSFPFNMGCVVVLNLANNEMAKLYKSLEVFGLFSNEFYEKQDSFIVQSISNQWYIISKSFDTYKN